MITIICTLAGIALGMIIRPMIVKDAEKAKAKVLSGISEAKTITEEAKTSILNELKKL
jgi:hypothetical protein